MPKYKAIVRLEDGSSHVVYQEANNGNEANQILSALYEQDVQAMVVFDDLDRQSNKPVKAQEHGEIQLLNPIDLVNGIQSDIPITTWNEAVRLIVVATIMFVALVIFAFVAGVVGR